MQVLFCVSVTISVMDWSNKSFGCSSCSLHSQLMGSGWLQSRRYYYNNSNILSACCHAGEEWKAITSSLPPCNPYWKQMFSRAFQKWHFFAKGLHTMRLRLQEQGSNLENAAGLWDMSTPIYGWVSGMICHVLSQSALGTPTTYDRWGLGRKRWSWLDAQKQKCHLSCSPDTLNCWRFALLRQGGWCGALHPFCFCFFFTSCKRVHGGVSKWCFIKTVGLDCGRTSRPNSG